MAVVRQNQRAYDAQVDAHRHAGKAAT
jgi:hypothetical protein